MARYLTKLTRKKLKRYLDKSEIIFERKLDKATWVEFLKWSQLDPDKHASITRLDGWLDEFAEFDCAYNDWKSDGSH
jgi:hypothetical protein